MSFIPRIIVALVVALIVGFGFMYYDKKTGAEWVVSPEQIAAGNGSVETRPGTVAVRAIRSEIADVLPYKWAISGILVGGPAFFMLRRRNA